MVQLSCEIHVKKRHFYFLSSLSLSLSLSLSPFNQFLVTKQRDKSEMLFRRLLKEDKGSGPWEGTSYVDYLCQLHKEIRDML